MGEFSELNDKLAEVRSHKLKLTRLVHEKEEEIGNPEVPRNKDFNAEINFECYLMHLKSTSVKILRKSAYCCQSNIFLRHGRI